MIHKIKKIIKNWLLKEELVQLKAIENRIGTIYPQALKAHNSYINAYNLAEEARKLVNSIVDVGIDVGMRSNDHSWAVVCIHGKIDYVKFVPLNQKDIYDVSHFLKRFEYSNRCTDSPFGYKEMINNHTLRW